MWRWRWTWWWNLEWLCWRLFQGCDKKSFIHSSSLLTGSDKIASCIWHHQIWINKDYALLFIFFHKCEQRRTNIISTAIAQFWFCKLRIKRDKSVSKRLGCGQFCLRYFRQVLTQALLFQPSRRNCFSTNLSKCADCICTAPLIYESILNNSSGRKRFYILSVS